MNKIKDFFYNKNDIIIVLIILLAAALIIYTRIDAIMAYPEQLAQEAAQQEASDAEKEEASAAKESSEAAASAVSVTLTDEDTPDTIADKLYEAGVISSDTEFAEFVTDSGREDEIKAGTFQINTGSSNEEILDIITN